MARTSVTIKDVAREARVSVATVSRALNGHENVAESVQKGTRVVVTGRLEQRSWETDNGDKRSKVEVVADEVAPSLRWATATVNRIERSQAGSGGGAPSGGGRPVANEPSPYDNEEPF